MEKSDSCRSPGDPTSSSSLEVTKIKAVHNVSDGASENLKSVQNVEEIPSLEVWGYLDFLEGSDIIPLTSDKTTYVIGTGPSADIKLEDKTFISPEHVEIEQRVSNPRWSGDLKVTIKDLETRNGTRKNNEALLTDQESLNHEDVIDLVSRNYNHKRNCKPIRFQFLLAKTKSLHREYEYLDTIWSGSNSEVKRARSHKLGFVVVIKLLRKSRPGNPFMLRRQRREVALMKYLSHPFIIELLDVVESSRDIGLVLPWASYGDLASFSSGRSLKHFELVQIYFQLLSGLEFLHSNGLIHRDIKPENILVFGDNPIITKIGDFGTLKKYNPLNRPTIQIGTPYHIAPEIGNGKGYTPKCDLFSLGIMFFQSVTTKLPFANPRNKVNSMQIESVININSRAFSRKGVKLLTGLLELNPFKRLSANQALELPFFVDNMKCIEFQRTYESSFQPKHDIFPCSPKYPL